MGREVYESAWHHPGLAWAGALLFVAWLRAARVPPRARTLGLALAAVAAVDALFTGALSPLPAGAAATALSIGFVVLGDARFAWLLARQVGHVDRPRSRARDAALALGAAALLPVTAWAATRALPSALPTPRHLFLVHETLAVGIAAACLVALRRAPVVGSLRYARRLARFELAQYAGWALADVALLVTAAEAPDGGGPAGHLAWTLRIVPNVAYYALFAPTAALALPDEART